MQKKLKVEFFCDSELEEVQEQVNEFLNDLHPDDVKDIKMSSSDGTFDVMIIYAE